MRCGWSSTICTRPEFSAGIICSSSAAITRIIGAAILLILRPRTYPAPRQPTDKAWHCSRDHRDNGWWAARNRSEQQSKDTVYHPLGRGAVNWRRVNDRSTSAWHHGGSVGVGILMGRQPT